MKSKIFSLLILLMMSTNFIYAESEECEDAKSNAETTLFDFESSVRSLSNCISYQYENYSDDCSSEFIRVQSAHSDYELAIFAVISECD